MFKIKTTESKISAGDSVSRSLSLAGLAMVAAMAVSLALAPSPVRAADDSGGASADTGGPSADTGGPASDNNGGGRNGGATGTGILLPN